MDGGHSDAVLGLLTLPGDDAINTFAVRASLLLQTTGDAQTMDTTVVLLPLWSMKKCGLLQFSPTPNRAPVERHRRRGMMPQDPSKC